MQCAQNLRMFSDVEDLPDHCNQCWLATPDEKKVINPMNGKEDHFETTRWRFGAEWPGKRCCARTRAGSACQKPALQGKARCQLHGGRAGAPSGVKNGNYRTGRFTKEAIQARREAARRIRALIDLGRATGMFQ